MLRPTVLWTRRLAKWPAQAIGLRLWWLVVRLMPRRVAVALGATLAKAVGPLLVSRSAALDQNLATAFPYLPKSARASLIRRIWSSFGRVLADYPNLHRLWRPSADVIEVIGGNHLDTVRKSGAFLLVGGHFGNWELPGIHVSRQGVKCTAIYAPDPNPLIDAMIRRCRLRAASANATLVPRQTSALRQVITALEKGEAVFLLADHRVEDGKPVLFFDHPAMTTLTPARLARRYGIPILPARAEQLASARYRITFSPPLIANTSRQPERDVLSLTAQLMQVFESWIRGAPDQWCYLKRRWPKERKSSSILAGDHRRVA